MDVLLTFTPRIHCHMDIQNMNTASTQGDSKRGNLQKSESCAIQNLFHNTLIARHLKTKKTMLNTAIQQNNIAASKIEHGEYLEAISILKGMIARIKDELREEISKEFQSEKAECTLEHMILQSLRRNHSWEERQECMFDQAVHISGYTENLPTAVSSILIFNFALALHLSADHTTDARLRGVWLSKSLSLYRLIMGFNRRSSLLGMIILNNVGLIHRSYNDKERAQQCFTQLLMIWMHSPARLKHLEGMIFNAIGWYDRLALPAAAA
eukprot:scaffold2156_cov115-Cylindrotheca_fusiformis.AAC.9